MSSANLHQVWQIVQQLDGREQFQLLQMLLQTLYRQLGYPPQQTPSAQMTNIRGKYAFVQTSSEAFAQRKQQEIALDR